MESGDFSIILGNNFLKKHGEMGRGSTGNAPKGFKVV